MKRDRRRCFRGMGIGAALIVAGVLLVLLSCPQQCLTAIAGCALCVIGGVLVIIR